MIEVNELSKYYNSTKEKIKALDSISFHVQKGKIFGLLGPNGAGKTTAVKLMMGFMHPSGGEIKYKGKALKASEPRKHFGYLPEQFQPNPNLTVSEYLGFQSCLAGIKRENLSHEVDTLLSLVDMSRYSTRRISRLSKGMGQRLGLAQAFANNPEVLILDEPTSGLDPLGKGDVINLLLELKRSGKTIFFCSHILSEVERLCTHIGILSEGKIRFLGSMDSFLDKWENKDMETAFRQEVQCEVS